MSTQISHTHGEQISLTDRLVVAGGRLTALIERTMARRKIYRRTYAELAGLSDRELQDISIARCEIRRIALEASHQGA